MIAVTLKPFLVKVSILFASSKKAASRRRSKHKEFLVSESRFRAIDDTHLRYVTVSPSLQL